MDMTQANVILADMRPGHDIVTDDVVEALRWLADAIRAAEARERDAVAAMREAAAKALETTCACDDIRGRCSWCWSAAKIRALPVPAAEVAPKPGPTTVDVVATQAMMQRVYEGVAAPRPFDAEAALVAMNLHLDTIYAGPVARFDMRRVVEAGLAAGRGTP